MRAAFDPSSLLDGDGDESFAAWPSWEEVVEIASDDDSESRIISHVPGDHSSFDLRWGPLDEDDADAWLSKSSHSEDTDDGRRETLVVNDVDRFYPPLADWMHGTFRFIPNWRMDDAQISLSERGGGIGPHVDNFSVFLIQAGGSRTWQVGTRTIDAREETDRMIDGLDVRVLEGWTLDGSEVKEWTLRPGDVLYLPPRVPHCGTALSGDCMTLSVGCRAPSVSDLVSKLAENLSSSLEEHAVRRYTDEDLLDTQYPSDSSYSSGEITVDAKERARDLLMDSLASTVGDDEWWDEFFGRYMTEQKRVRNNYPVPLDDWVEGESAPDEWRDATVAIKAVLEGNAVLYRAEGISFAYSSVPLPSGKTSHRFFVNGEMWQSAPSDVTAPGALPRLFRVVANHRRIEKETLLGASLQQTELASEAISFLEELISAGVLYASEE
ncbi:hypothetical protein ACHAXT_007158 [Thalassiosira profunda]